MKAYITNIQRFSVNDGPGIRTLIFFAGCGMRCVWCQNPEALRQAKQVMFDPAKCCACGTCAVVCPYGACVRGACVRGADGIYRIDREKCMRCFACTEVCNSEARKLTFAEITLGDLVQEVEKDVVFFKNSNGGVTLSGGEALLQTGFCRVFLEQIKAKGIRTAVETAGYYDRIVLEQTEPYLDLFLFDLKMIDAEKHRKYTGVGNEGILTNFRYAAEHKPVILRVALIPGVNDGEEFEKVVLFAKGCGVGEVHILPFHNLGDSKYDYLDMHYGLREKSTENERQIQLCAQYAKEAGMKVSIGGTGE